MVLANRTPGSVDPDLHAVPTVHVDAREGRDLERWLGRHPRGRVTLRSLGVDRADPVLAAWSRTGDLGSGLVKPDLLAVGTGVLAAGRPDAGESRWQLVSGTSVAAAQVSGAAAVVRGERTWTAPTVRSALAGTAVSVGGRTDGAGLVRPQVALSAGLAVEVAPADYRAWLDGRRAELGTAALVLDRDRRTVTRMVVNLSRRTQTFAARVVGLGSVQAAPAILRLAPGASATVTIRVVGRTAARDQGAVEWRGATGAVSRWPVVVTR
jgi:minor extracellular serine protease Vpr